MSPYELELEVCAYEELMAVMSGRKSPGPTSQFLDRTRNTKLYTGKPKRKKAVESVPVTPAEMGWE